MLRTKSQVTTLTATIGVGLGVLCGTTSTNAGVVVNAVETGGSVFMSGSGSVDLSAWTNQEAANVDQYNSSGIVGGGESAGTAFQLGTPGEPIDYYNMPVNFIGPTSMGPGTANFLAQSGSGDKFGLTSSVGLDRVIVPGLYVSGDPIFNTTTWAGATFASLGLVPGSYTWTWGSGPTADSVTMNIGLEAISSFLAETIPNLGLDLFNGPNGNANAGRRGSLANRASDAAELIDAGDIDGAIDELESLLAKIDGQGSPPDWMDNPPQELIDTVIDLIAQLESLL